MILRLGVVDVVGGVANSLCVQPVAILELSEPFGGAPPVFSYMPLSQCKLQVLCLKRTTACDRV